MDEWESHIMEFNQYIKNRLGDGLLSIKILHVDSKILLNL